MRVAFHWRVRFTAGDHVRVRGERWIVEGTATFGETTRLELTGGEHGRTRCTLLVPFDRPVIDDRIPKIRAVTPRQWASHLRRRLAERRVHGELQAAHGAAIDILPFQLEPALALIQGRATRFLLADEVGLGKTIQAGLMLAELRRRGWCDRALIVSPAGLRQQWADELQRRFDIPSTIVDAAALSELAGALPSEVNPWAIEPVSITSIDFLKQTEVLEPLTALVWDLLIIDEAHQCSAATQRRDAVQAIASMSRHIVLVTATPHDGDEEAYRALCALGAVAGDSSMALFRRTREQAGVPRRRRAHLLAVHLTADALEMHRRLDRYVRQLWTIACATGRRDASLVAIVLAKRAFSSTRALLRSLERRVAGLSDERGEAAQPPLPFDESVDASDDPVMPLASVFDRIEDERAALLQIIEAAQAAQMGDRKMHALARLLRRAAEPVIVFTEYRDTLDALADATSGLRQIAMLHGGQSAQERREAVAAFTTGRANLLLATDAGSEGLNLQRNCRLVVNLELPWNPIRLEQRIGRVDRIGQSRTVHAIHLFAAGTAEDEILARLQRRIDRIRMSEIEIAGCILNRAQAVPSPPAAHPRTTSIDVREEARSEAQRLMTRRAVAMEMPPPADSDVIVPVIVHRLRRLKLRRQRWYLVALMHAPLAARTGRLIEDMLVPIGIPVARPAPALARREARATVEALLAAVQPDLTRVAAARARWRADEIGRESTDLFSSTLAREQHIRTDAASRPALLVQLGLFDNRAVSEHLDGHARSESIRIESEAFTRLIESNTHVFLPRNPEIALLVLTTLSPGSGGLPAC